MGEGKVLQQWIYIKLILFWCKTIVLDILWSYNFKNQLAQNSSVLIYPWPSVTKDECIVRIELKSYVKTLFHNRFLLGAENHPPSSSSPLWSTSLSRCNCKLYNLFHGCIVCGSAGVDTVFNWLVANYGWDKVCSVF